MGTCATCARHTIPECHGCTITSLLGNGREKGEQQEAWHGAELSPDSAHQLWHRCSPGSVLCPPMPSAIPARCGTPADSHPWPGMVLALPVFSSPCSTAWSCSCTKSSLLRVTVYRCPSFACMPISQLKNIFLAHLLRTSSQCKTSQYKISPL